jgi:hypothetical protein
MPKNCLSLYVQLDTVEADLQGGRQPVVTVSRKHGHLERDAVRTPQEMVFKLYPVSRRLSIVRLFLTIVALLVLVSSTTAFAEGDAAAGAEKKGKKSHGKRGHRRHHHHGHAHAGESNGGPFADVPRGHWAYDAVQKSAEAGILQGWNNRFHGNKVVNRYQMAVVVARMLDRVGVLRANGKVITAQDIANLESLVIEFADELALLNVKVSTLEDTVAGLKKDVDLIKADLRGVGARAGITGVMEARAVFTDNSAPAYRFGSLPALTQPSAATSVLGRYNGSAVSGNGGAVVTIPGTTGPNTYNERNFFTVSTFAVNIDREFDPHTHFHAQVNINAEGEENRPGESFVAPLVGSGADPVGIVGPAGALNANGGIGTPLSGRGSSFNPSIIVNELYVVFDDWFTDGVNGRMGIWALPMNTEVNGPSRTYLWTITPSIANSKWESLRPVGLDIFQHNDKDSWTFYVGFFTPGDTSNQILRSGTLISMNNQGLTPGSLVANGTFSQLDGVATGITGLGRFPTPNADASFTDAPRSIDGQNLANDDIGFYVNIGQHPTCKDHRGFSWHVAYFDRNGNIHRGREGAPSLTDWNAWQAFISYQWSDVLLMAQYYDAESKNYSFADLGIGSGIQLDARRFASTPFVNFFGADTRSQSFMALLNWQFTRRGNFTIRYEDAHDSTGAARLEAEVWTLAFNWRTSDHGWLQLEYISPETRSTSENGVRNTIDINDDLFQVNYKLNW